MASGHFIANSKFTLLGYIHLGHLYDAIWKLIAYGSNKLFTIVNTKNFLVMYYIVVDHFLDHLILILIGCPPVRINVVVIKAH